MFGIKMPLGLLTVAALHYPGVYPERRDIHAGLVDGLDVPKLFQPNGRKPRLEMGQF